MRPESSPTRQFTEIVLDLVCRKSLDSASPNERKGPDAFNRPRPYNNQANTAATIFDGNAPRHRFALDFECALTRPSDMLDERTLRRGAYRLAGEVFGLSVLGIRVREVSLDSITITGLGGIVFGTPEDIESADPFARILGELAIRFSGVSSDLEPFEANAFPHLDIELRKQIVGFAERSVGPISGLAEALLAHGTLSEEQCCRIIAERIKQRIV